MKAYDLKISGLKIISPTNHNDDRGFFSEIWKDEIGFPEFKQMNMSVSKNCTFRGLHYQWDKPQGKLIRVVKGKAVFFELDVRSYSPTFGQHETVPLSHETNEWLWVPSGFANGFFSLENDTTVMYMCTEKWSKNEGSVNYNALDYSFNYAGGMRNVSDKDLNAPFFENLIPHFESISHFFSNDHKSIIEITH